MPGYADLATLREVISQVAMEVGIAQSNVTSVIASSDQDIKQMFALLSAVAAEVTTEEPYQTTLGDGYWVADSSGTPQLGWTADDNLILFDRRLAINGLKWRFLHAKGLDYGEAMRDFTTRMNKLAAAANARVLDLDLDGGRWL